MAVETTRGDVLTGGGAPCRPAAHPAERAVPAPRTARSLVRPAPGRPAGRRGAPALPAVRPAVCGGTRPVEAVAGVPLAVVHRRRRAAAVALGLVLAVLVALAVSMLSGPPAGAVPEATTVTVVRGGESLADVAHRSAPDAETAAAVERIRGLNGLSSSDVATGSPLVVPAG